MGRPDMGGDKDSVGAGLQGNFEQVAAVQPQNRPAVRVEVADQLQPFRQRFCRLQ